jgi:hypothetical protein
MATVIPLFKSASFDPDITRAMAQAYEQACKQLNDSATDLVKEVIAKRIIQLAQTGVHDPLALRDRALDALGGRLG